MQYPYLNSPDQCHQNGGHYQCNGDCSLADATKAAQILGRNSEANIVRKPTLKIIAAIWSAGCRSCVLCHRNIKRWTLEDTSMAIASSHQRDFYCVRKHLATVDIIFGGGKARPEHINQPISISFKSRVLEMKLPWVLGLSRCANGNRCISVALNTNPTVFRRLEEVVRSQTIEIDTAPFDILYH